jgi:outer membrane protein OmpA-like peptidoglycan-associated protein
MEYLYSMKSQLSTIFICEFCAIGFLLLAGAAIASVPQKASAQPNPPSYHVTMVPRTILTINYQNRTKTGVGFQGSPLMPLAKGHAEIESKGGRIAVSAEFRAIEAPSKFGSEYLTYVLWAITPEGKANNLGELLVSDGKSKLDATTTLQTFGLIVTAEPYYAVTQPSDVVVLENAIEPATVGTLQSVNANYQLFSRGFYSYAAPVSSENLKHVPLLEVEEARNAVAIAKNDGAAQYSAETFAKAQLSLQNAEATKGDKKVVVQDARDAVQNAAAAIQTTISRRQEEALAMERAAAAQQTADAQAEAQAADAKQRQEAAARREAELQSENAALQAEKEAQARALAEAHAQQSGQVAAQAQQAAAQAEAQREQLRATLLEQFNRVLPTTDTARGLQANLADILFATGRFDLRPSAREALAKFSGIVIAHPGLKMQVEGYTDSVGSDMSNQTLSENRASSVKAYLIGQGIDPTAITSTGFGKSNPVASNDTSEGRQQNRRVEIIISGEIIGTQIGH